MAFPELSIRVAGSCVHPEHVVMRNRVFAPMRFPAMYAIVEHPREGVMLFDTGYSERFHDVTSRLPNKLYALTTPMSLEPEQTARAELARRGIRTDDVRAVICSHFHADHVAALSDFPKARYVFLESAWHAVKGLSGLSAVRKGFLPELVPTDFGARAQPIGRERERPLPRTCAPFTRGFDLCGDGTVLAVPLPGHAEGQIGLYVETAKGPFFLVADACWTSKSYQELVMPHPITRLLFADTKVYARTLREIHDLHVRAPEVHIVPSHCEAVLRAHGAVA